MKKIYFEGTTRRETTKALSVFKKCVKEKTSKSNIEDEHTGNRDNGHRGKSIFKSTKYSNGVKSFLEYHENLDWMEGYVEEN